MLLVQTRLARSRLVSPELSVLWQPLSRRPVRELVIGRIRVLSCGAVPLRPSFLAPL